MDRTYFGPAINDRINNNTLNLLATSTRTNKIQIQDVLILNNLYENNIEEKIKLLNELEILSNKELLGVYKNEMHKNEECLYKF